MRPRSFVRTSALVLPLPVAAVAVLARSVPNAEASPGRLREIARIRAHFDSVLTELPARDLSTSSPTQRAHRAELLATLRAYRDRGVFPHNYDFPGRAVPYFVDRKTGTLCAVAHLLATSGRRDIVDRVARTDNNVWVPALAHDTAFTHWLDAEGLTLAEAARIQVPYVASDVAMETRVGLAIGALATSAGSVVTTLVNATTNLDGHGRTRNVLGVVLGGASVGLGAATMATDRDLRGIGGVAVASGAIGALVATNGLVKHRRTVLAQRRGLHPVVTPAIPTDAKSGAGLSVAMRF